MQHVIDRFVSGIIVTAITPLFALSIFSGIGSGIWLASLGEWGGIGYGALAMFAGPFIYVLFGFVGALVNFLAVYLLDRNVVLHTLGMVCLFVGIAWTWFISSSWSLFVFHFFLQRSNGDTLMPYLLWSYTAAVAPGFVLASKDKSSNMGTQISVFFLQAACASIIVTIGFMNLHLDAVLWTFCGIMGFGLLVNGMTVIALLRASSN